MSVGVPIKLLHEAEGNPVTVELQNGEVYRGKLEAAEDNMNLHMVDVVCRSREGRITKLDRIYVRGSQVRLIVMPDILKSAPAFQKVQAVRSKALSGKDKEWVGAASRGGKAKKRSAYAARG